MPESLPRVPGGLTLVPNPDESLIGYVFRLASYRRLSSVRFLAVECGFKEPSNQPRPEWLAALAAFAAVDASSLVAISYGPPDRRHAVFRGQRVGQSVLERRGSAHRRLCPHCLDESPHHRAIWDLRYVAACPVHGCLLADECWSCGGALFWRGRDLTRCHCAARADLRKSVAPHVAPRDLEATAAVHGLLGDARFAAEADRVRAMAPFHGLMGADIAEFLFRIGLERMGRRRKVFSSEDPGDLAWEAHVALRFGLETVSDWPGGFHRALDEMRERWPRAGRSLSTCAGAVEFWLAGLQEGSAAPEIAAAVADYRALDAVRRGMEPPGTGVTPYRRRF